MPLLHFAGPAWGAANSSSNGLPNRHYTAWKRAADQDGYTLICKSDYVPCVGMGTFPRFWPLSDQLALGYLYVGSPRLLALVNDRRYLRAHSAPLVSYVGNAAIARILCDVFGEAIDRYGTQTFFPFDAQLQWFAISRPSPFPISLINNGFSESRSARKAGTKRDVRANCARPRALPLRAKGSNPMSNTTVAMIASHLFFSGHAKLIEWSDPLRGRDSKGHAVLNIVASYLSFGTSSPPGITTRGKVIGDSPLTASNRKQADASEDE